MEQTKKKQPTITQDEARARLLAHVTRDGPKPDPTALCHIRIGRTEWRVEARKDGKDRTILDLTTKAAISPEAYDQIREVLEVLRGALGQEIPQPKK